jgi:branched-chain amino acid transport system permease protein
MWHKMMAFFIACVLAGIGGSFYAHYMSYISPGSFTMNESLLLVIMVVTGGSESIFGVIIGVILMTLISELGRDAVKFQPLIYGSALLLILLFVPGGLWSLRRSVLRTFPFLPRGPGSLRPRPCALNEIKN